ncbi:MAG: type I glyceraldehyde-3-phosphate dehydrogenase [Flavobacteriales bacterium]|nr:type I glyceraldehyde-3-phosphate dehydrogenase [Flavobacteriales bacterium]MCX7768374.1 type I glyceraldehyde-3-phosphate dehydrogenase [Flavobacteriales bacterium]MDW8409066.1 type I glyceraldehyde-3-phosphate dehydrogenase [Flavobacteriales bacterium]
MKRVRIGINGFGRIGRCVFRQALLRPQVQVVAVNDQAPLATLVHLLNFDSVFGRLEPRAELSGNNSFRVGEQEPVTVFSATHPSQIPWDSVGVDFVIECTGHFRSAEKARPHLERGAHRVIISAPTEDDETPTVCMGINHTIISPSDLIVSNASCTTNSAAPLLDVLHRHFGLEKAFVTTVHAYTSDQRLQDAPHSDLRRARAAAVSIVPTTTGAAKALYKIFPHLKGRLGGAGVRVPVVNGSLTDLTAIVSQPVTASQVNEIFKEESQKSLKGILQYSEDPLVSADILGNPHSCIYDAGLTTVLDNMVKVVGWYDNEYGYSARLLDLAEYLAGLTAM